MSSSSSSVLGRNYIVDQKPDKFGGKQEEYLQRSEAAIQSGVAQIREAVQEGKDLKALFFKILDQFATERHAIAIAHGTKNADQFGRKRTDCVCLLNFTPLAEDYEEFNPKILSLFQKVLKGKVPFRNPITNKKFSIEDECLGRKCYFEIELVTGEDIAEREWDKHILQAPKLMRKYAGKVEADAGDPDIDESHFPPNEEEQLLLNKWNAAMKRVKANCNELYIHDKMQFVLNGLNDTFPMNEKMESGAINPRYSPANLRSMLVLGKMRLEINGMKYAISEYTTWMYRNGSEDPVERLKSAHVIITHEDRFLIDETLQEIAAVFERAVRSDSSVEKVNELKDQVALTRYLFAHAMPFARGSAAIGEWLEKTIYQYHGYEIERNPKTMGDLEALTTLWSVFRKEKYDQTIKLTKEV
jgi:Avirulence protein